MKWLFEWLLRWTPDRAPASLGHQDDDDEEDDDDEDEEWEHGLF